jgi:histidinol-phosphate aminotransferase
VDDRAAPTWEDGSMSLLLRSVMATLPAYVAGRTVPGALKLASNETSYPLLPAVAARVSEALSSANRYPDPSQARITQALADRLGFTAGQVMVGCGSVALCQQVVQTVADAGDEVLYAWRSFEAYPIVAGIAGAVPVAVPVRSDQSIDLETLAAAITVRTKVVFVCTPNNPTGTALRTEELTRFIDRVPDRVLIVLDEAYREFVSDPEVPDGLTYLDRPNVVVLRTFSKAYGLAGLRIGYGVARDPALVAAVRKTQVPFAVSQLAQEAALACLEPSAEKELMQRVDEVIFERSRVTAALMEAGFFVPPSQANFVWLPLAGRTVAFSEHCEEQGVIVRAFADAGARVTIGTAAENHLFLAAASSFNP